jgi:hypothetical protein
MPEERTFLASQTSLVFFELSFFNHFFPKKGLKVAKDYLFRTIYVNEFGGLLLGYPTCLIQHSLFHSHNS